MVTPEQLAGTLNLVLRCAKGHIGEGVEQYASSILAAWDAEQRQAQPDHLADDPEYAALVKAQLEIERQIAEAHQEAAWQRLFGARNAETGLAAPATRGGDGTEIKTEQSTYPTMPCRSEL